MTIGNELRDARERLGLSREQISFATKIPLRKIAALEEDAFDRLPTGIYLDGIASGYAREVGLAADELIRRLRAHVAPPPLETLEKIVTVRQAREHERDATEPRLSLAHGMLAFATVVLVLAVLSVGVHFYTLQPSTEPRHTVATETDTIAQRVAQETQDTFPSQMETGGFDPVDQRAEPGPVAEPIPVEERGVPPQRVAEPIPSHVPAARQSAADAMHSVTVSDVAGAWTLDTLVESSSLSTFEGLRLGYRLELRQKDGRIEGTGRKISENGVALSGARRTPIAVQGTVDGGRLRLTFGEEGARRRSTGTFDLVLEDSGALRGVFSSSAARSAGVVEARRL